MTKSEVDLSLDTYVSRALGTWEKILVEIASTSYLWLLDGAPQPPTFSTRPVKLRVTNENKETGHQV